LAARLLLAVCLAAVAAIPSGLAWAQDGKPSIDTSPVSRDAAAREQAAGQRGQPAEPVPLLPDLQSLPPTDLKIERLSDGGRQLRLTNVVWNSGDGPLELMGQADEASEQMVVYQRITYSDGSTVGRLVGAFVWHPTHAHFHFENFAQYEIWSVTPQRELHTRLTATDKVSWCVIESNIVDRGVENFAPYRAHTTCDQEIQGLQPGWGDRYGSHLPGQSIDISWLPDGVYALRTVANPGAAIIERSYTNNVATLLLEIAGDRVSVLSEGRLEHCRASGRC
jgi:hypothetical protein